MALQRRAVLAVSGGVDSMVMATLLFDTAPHLVAGLATFDHGTGAAAREAVDMVREWGRERQLPVRVGRAEGLPRTESAWRRARWTFLRDAAAAHGVPVATAHTEDDQAETIFMRLLRQSGVRGLAGLLAPGPVLRPMLGTSRRTIRDLAARQCVTFHEDPSNADLRFLRNRVRLELLPRLEHEHPGFRQWLLELGRAAADWRMEVAQAVDRFWAPIVQTDGSTFVARHRDRLPVESEAALFWPEVAGRVGVALDRRGTARLASFTTKRESGLRMPLSGGIEVLGGREGWTLQRAGARVAGSSPPERPAPLPD
ncbi:MAG: tRNA lysidine(34) synthetase TilS [Gemmatimonadaceae bacterium]|nr:tRNA lysidine(34) synthetase TilS [Gemmatimonadaceae bacterium]